MGCVYGRRSRKNDRIWEWQEVVVRGSCYSVLLLLQGLPFLYILDPIHLIGTILYLINIFNIKM